ncbi:MAG: cytochrome c biogenesis protein CcdA [Patescibacteria group bacterium]|nr:cytochrome c biogenesis protein CcdA [Patescibacteria group bacterium]
MNSCGAESILCQATNFSLWLIAGAALVDSINPCAIAVLLILLTALLSQENRKKILKMGLTFTTAIYLAYLLLGLGLLGVVNLFGLAVYFHRAIGFLAIVLGILNIKDYFNYGGGGFVMEIPRKWRPKLKLIIQGTTSYFGVFVIGFLVTLFELPCTGGPYLFVLGLLSQGIGWSRVLFALLFYNLIFVTPLILLTTLIHFGFATIERVDKWKERNIKTLHLLAGIIMLFLGFWVFLS